MIIEIKEELFNKVLQIVKTRNMTLYKELQIIKPVEATTKNNTIKKAREIKTNRVKESIKIAIEDLKKNEVNPTKYKVHKKTKIAYTTLNKYFNEILNELS